MLNSDLIIRRASGMLEAQGLDPKLSPQARAVILAISEAMNGDLFLVNKAVALQANAVKETPSGRMNRPTLDEVKAHGKIIGLAEIECEKFFNFYQAKGWIVGGGSKGAPMKLWTAALSNWKRNSDSPNNGASVVILGREYERVLEAMKTLQSGYDSHRDMLPDDRAKFTALKSRRDELRGILGIKI
jgi:hypothetical protein